jgi:hypothetical protein
LGGEFEIVNTTRFTLGVLFAALICVAGCVTKPAPDPLAGWQLSRDQDPSKLDKAIWGDYHNYIQKLPDRERKFVGIIYLLEDKTGQHAVKLEIPLNGVWVYHVLIYDKDNNRIKAIKYADGRYAS